MNGAKLAELRSLLLKALDASTLLRDYTNENFGVFATDDDEKIAEIVDQREKMIEALAGIESKIDGILEDAPEYAFGKALPPDLEEARRAVRAVLNDITAKDMEIMQLVSGRMQEYRVETLRARSKQSFSAYLRTVAFSRETGDGVDLTQ